VGRFPRSGVGRSLGVIVTTHSPIRVAVAKINCSNAVIHAIYSVATVTTSLACGQCHVLDGKRAEFEEIIELKL
jgi:hypothetical protein